MSSLELKGQWPIIAAILIAASGSVAAAQRTFVSSTGNDGDPCSLVAPCRSFAAAMLHTDATGEIIVLDAAGYGPVTVNQSVSIVAPNGVYGGISVLSPGGNGITVDGPGIAVHLRGLTINGTGMGGGSGILFVQGAKLTVEDCEISNMDGHGILASAANSTVFVRSTVMRALGNHGFFAAGSVVAALDGLHIEGSNQTGVVAAYGARITLANSVLSKNVLGVHAHSLSATNSAIMVTRAVISGGLEGVHVTADGGSSAVVTTDALVINDVATAAFEFTALGGPRSSIPPGTTSSAPAFPSPWVER